MSSSGLHMCTPLCIVSHSCEETHTYTCTYSSRKEEEMEEQEEEEKKRDGVCGRSVLRVMVLEAVG